MLDSSGSHLEDFLERIETLPPQAKRNLQLVHELGKSSTRLNEALHEEQQKYISESKAKIRKITDSNSNLTKIIANPEALAKMDAMRKQIRAEMMEKMDVLNQTAIMVDTHIDTLDGKLRHFESWLRDTGNFEVADGLRPGDEVAARMNPDENIWILAKVRKYDQDANSYQVADSDDAQKKYEVPADQIVVLPQLEHLQYRKFSKG
jgi:hypothetical protein